MTRRRGGSGQALLEFALVVPIFLLLLMALIDFGRVIYAQNAITQDTRNATRFASVSAPQDFAEIKQHAKIVSPGVDLPNSAITGDGGVVDNFYPDGVASPGSRAVVQIEITVPILTPIMSMVVGGDFTVRARSEELIK